MEYFSVFSPNAGQYGPEKTPYLDTSRSTIKTKCFRNNVKNLMKNEEGYFVSF